MGTRLNKNLTDAALTPSQLFDSAVGYLARYAASTAQVKNFLQRKCQRHMLQGGQDARADIAGTLEKLAQKKLLNDVAFAETKVVALRRRGYGRARMAAMLQAKGVAAAIVKNALPSEAEELAAALAYAQRRRLGIFGATQQWQDKDWAKLQRAGYSPDVIRQLRRLKRAEGDE
jgi:regulatory protein